MKEMSELFILPSILQRTNMENIGDPKYTRGVYHDALGLAMLPLAFGLYSFLAWFMSSLFVDEDRLAGSNVIVRRRPSL